MNDHVSSIPDATSALNKYLALQGESLGGIFEILFINVRLNMKLLQGAIAALLSVSVTTQFAYAQYTGGYYAGMAAGNMYLKDGYDYVADGGNGAIAGVGGYIMNSGTQQYSLSVKAANVKNNTTTATRELTAAGLMVAPMGSSGIDFGSGITYSDYDGDMPNNAKFGAGFRWKISSILFNIMGSYNTNLVNNGNAFDMGGVAEYQYGPLSLIGNYGGAATANGKANLSIAGADKDALYYGGASIDYRFKLYIPMVARAAVQGTTYNTIKQARTMISLRTPLYGKGGSLIGMTQSPWPTNLGVWSSLGI